MSSIRRKALPVLALAAMAAVWTGCAAENYPQSIFQPVTDFGAQINDLFAGIFWWTMLVLVVVQVVLVYILIRYRDRPGAEPRKIYGNNIAEILWTLGPAIIVVFILVPTVRTIFDTYERPEGDVLVVDAIGHQWWWEFRYPELGITTANELHLPIDRPIEVRLSSADVIHNWWVPKLGGKRYNFPQPAMAPGEPEKHNFNVLYFNISEPGEYLGQCAEFCGVSHAIMRMMVVAQEPEEFEAWVAEMREPAGAVPQAAVPAPTQPAEEPAAQAELAEAPVTAPMQDASLVAEGYQVFMRTGCAACHAINGTPAIGVLGPNLTGIGSRWSIGAGLFDNTDENMARWIRNAPALKPEAKMQEFPNLSDSDMKALVAYLRSLQ